MHARPCTDASRAVLLSSRAKKPAKTVPYGSQIEVSIYRMYHRKETFQHDRIMFLGIPRTYCERKTMDERACVYVKAGTRCDDEGTCPIFFEKPPPRRFFCESAGNGCQLSATWTSTDVHHRLSFTGWIRERHLLCGPLQIITPIALRSCHGQRYSSFVTYFVRKKLWIRYWVVVLALN